MVVTDDRYDEWHLRQVDQLEIVVVAGADTGAVEQQAEGRSSQHCARAVAKDLPVAGWL